MSARVLVVDDSAFARTVLARLLRGGGLTVVGTARDGGDALEQIAALDPDVVTLDLAMPHVDGLAVLRALAGRARPRVIVVSSSAIDSAQGLEALTLGALTVVTKPTALATDRLLELRDELVATVLAAVTVAPAGIDRRTAPVSPTAPGLVVIGASTGGPQALTRLIAGLPADLRVPVAIALHIPAGYTEGLAERLDRLSPVHVVEASDGLALVPGTVVLARGGQHLRIDGRVGEWRARIGATPIRPYTPSVDELFLSAAKAGGARTLGIVLTGMGDDGLAGARAIAAAGGTLITEAAETCVVYGMPRCVQEARLGAVAMPLPLIAQEIMSRVQ